MPNKSLFTCVCLAALASGWQPLTASAQDLGSLLRGIGQVRNLPSGTQDLFSAIVSIAEVSTGRVNPDILGGQNTEGKVVLYRTATCGYCKQASAYMQSRQIPFIERDVETSERNRAEFKRLGGRGVPLMVMGDKTLTGFTKTTFDQSYAAFRPAEPAMQNRPESASAASKAIPVTVADSAAGVLRSGDVLVAKIVGVPVYRESEKSGKRLATLGRGDEVVFMGDERNGMYRVASVSGEGWVDSILMKRP